MDKIMVSWIDMLKIEVHKTDFNTIDFLNKYINIIDGPNRNAKLKKVKRQVQKLVNTEDIKNDKNKEKIFENIYNPLTINIENKKIIHNSISFGVIGDTQFNSKYSQITYLHKYYDLCSELGITDIYHTGDIDDGEKMRPGHVYENYTQGADDHVKEIIKNYPARKGIVTHFITGNHDASFRKHCGLDIGYRIADKREDLDYLGRDIAIVNITPKTSMMLRHPWDGTAYAISYKIQKMIESMDENTRPNILCVGHYHKMEYLYYLGVHSLQTGCFQSSTPFTIGKGIRVSMGGWVVTVDFDKEGNLISFSPKAITFNTPIKDDYKNFSR